MAHRSMPFMAKGGLWVRLVSLALVTATGDGHAQTTAVSYATQYFLYSPSANLATTNLPPNARDIIVAKIHLISGPVYLNERDQSGALGPRPPGSYLFRARIEIIEVLSGAMKSGEQLDVSFGRPTPGRQAMVPATPAMKARPYFVTSYVDQENVRALLGFPASQGEFERWQEEWFAYERLRGRPGARD